LHPELILEREKCLQFLGLEAIQLIKRTLIRFSDIKKMPLIIKLVLKDKGVSFFYLTQIEMALLPYNEFHGNFEIDLHKFLKENLSIRYNTPRRLKKPEFHRGYRDHGSMSSVHDRARKAANTAQDILINEQLGNIRSAPNPLQWAKDHGIIPKENQ
jgi:hypothetical protein